MTTAASFQSGNATIHYSDTGSGAPVVLVHGFTASAEMWSEFPDLPGFRRIAIDCRGHGASDKPKDIADYGDTMVEDVRRLMGHLGIAQAHLVGYSMGAEICIRYATLYPNAVLSLIAGGSGWSQQGDADNYNILGASLRESGSFGEAVSAMSRETSDEELAALDEFVGDQDPAVLAAVAGGMQQIICLPASTFEGCRFPVLGITGELDPERGNVEKLAEVFSNFRLSVIDGADHIGAVSDPAFYQTIGSFLTED